MKESKVQKYLHAIFAPMNYPTTRSVVSLSLAPLYTAIYPTTKQVAEDFNSKKL
jgi:hypothetical protein